MKTIQNFGVAVLAAEVQHRQSWENVFATQCHGLGQSFGDSSHDQFIVTLEIVGRFVFTCVYYIKIEAWFSHLYSDGAQEIGMCSFFDWWFQMCLHIPSC